MVDEPAEVTIIVAPRERFSRSQQSLEALYARTTVPFKLIYVDGNSPRRIARYLRAAAAERGFRLIRTERYLSPNHARNLALAQVDTPYVVFVDNDLDVTDHWLEPLLRCAKETGAWAVGPLYYEGDPHEQIIHMAGGDLQLTGEPGSRSIATDHRYQKMRVPDAPELRRETCGFVEFHCALVRTDVFERIGLLDEELLSTREHLDLCLRIQDKGGEVWFEPASVVHYVSPPPVPLSDVPFFWLRWSDAWAHTSLEHFCQTYGIDRSYLERVHVMRSRRQIVFDPMRRMTRRVLGERAAHALDRVLVRGEPALNRALVRVAGVIAPPAT